VLTIQGTVVRQVAEVPVEDEVAAVVFSPDGTRAWIAKNGVHNLQILLW